MKLLKYIRTNNHFINFLDNKQLSYGLIYSLKLIKLEILKTYIRANLASNFIRLSKFLTSALISFVQKNDSSLYLHINYQGFKNLTIKNCYLLSLICKSFICLSYIKYFS